MDAGGGVTDENGGVTATRVVHQADGLAPLSDGSVVTIGAYDGVHLGHRKVLQLVRDLADARGLDAALVTFDRHPAQVVRPESAPKLLTSLDQKLELLTDVGLLDVVCVLRFDEERSHETAEEFVREVLVGLLRARVVVVGADFHFGHKRGGNVALLEQMGTDLGFEVLGLGLVAPEGEADHEPFSSTRVRGALANGDVGGRGAAARPAPRGAGHGRCAATSGVGSSASRPRTWRSPTRSASRPTGSTPGSTCAADGIWRPAAISLGRRPTFYEDAELVRCSRPTSSTSTGDLYDQPASVRFVERLRGEQRSTASRPWSSRWARTSTRPAGSSARADARTGPGPGLRVTLIASATERIFLRACPIPLPRSLSTASTTPTPVHRRSRWRSSRGASTTSRST